jgi:hypothetical protein
MLRAMRARALPIVVLSCMSSLVAVGCAYGEVRQVIRAQFASELNCSEVQIKRRDTWYAYEGPDQYKVMGCGEVRTYTCPAHQGLTSYDKPACPWVKGDADAPTHTADTSEDAAMEAPATAPGKPAAAAPKPAAAAAPAKPAAAPAKPAAAPAAPAKPAAAPAAPAKPAAPAAPAAGGTAAGKVKATLKIGDGDGEQE